MRTIDFHSHILPRADHGSDSIATSKKQLEHLKSGGIDTVIATPHFYPNRHSVNDFIARREKAYSEICKENTFGIQILKGAELLVSPSLEKMEGLDRLTVNGTKAILLEMPMSDTWSSGLVEAVDAIRNAGYTPVMAHINRYTENQSDILAELGVTFQLNASCLCKLFGKRRFLNLAENGYVSALGTDIHGDDKAAVQKYVKAKKVLGDELFESIMKKSEHLIGIN